MFWDQCGPAYRPWEHPRHGALQSGPSRVTLNNTQCLKRIPPRWAQRFHILRYYCQCAKLKATWLSNGGGPIQRGEGGGGTVCEPSWLPSHNCRPCINTSQHWQSVVYSSWEDFLSGWKNVNQSHWSLITLLIKENLKSQKKSRKSWISLELAVCLACGDAGCSFLSETLKVLRKDWTAGLSPQNHEAAPPIKSCSHVYSKFHSVRRNPNQLSLPSSWMCGCCKRVVVMTDWFKVY